AGFAPGLVVGIDAGMTLRASDRPQTIAGWRPILGQTVAPDAQATVALGRAAEPPPQTVAQSSLPPTPAPKRRGVALWLAIAAAVLLAVGGGYYYFASVERKAAEQQAEKERQEQARLRADAEAREKAEQTAAL